MPTEPNPPKVFISYSHDSRLHLDRVLVLADRLRAEGIDCNLDQYEPAPAEGWPRWMDKQFQNADFILVVCTETYCRRFEGREEHGKGLGVKWEGAIITDELYSNESVNKRFIPILFSDNDTVHVPQKLQHYMHHLIADDVGYEELYRRLTNQPRVVKPPLGKLRSFETVNKLQALPSENRQQEFTPIQKEPPPNSQSRSLPPPPQVIISHPPPKPMVRNQNYTEDLGNGVKLEMLFIHEGMFLMGSEEWIDTQPIHNVTLSPFYIGKFQVTQRQWQTVMGYNPSHSKGNNLPVEQVTWTMASEFCEKLSKLTGKKYRLPTEAEWEYTCRAGSTTRYCFGDDDALLERYAWYNRSSGGKTHSIGVTLPNAWGIYDMHGNVWEWCQDWYAADYYKLSPDENPQGPQSGLYRILRGGSWSNEANYCRSARRRHNLPAQISEYVGCRVVCVAKPL